MNETQFANALVEEANAADYQECDFKPEVHYNHYGSRGCVDLVNEVETPIGNTEIEVYELKSEAALENVTGANEIVRQFNKHKEYFFDGTTKYPARKYAERTFYLLFYATERTVSHVRENRELYSNVFERGYNNSVVNVWHEDVGQVPIVDERVWDEDTNAEKIREVIA